MGKAQRKLQQVLDARRKSFDSLSREARRGRKRPGSLNPRKAA